MKAKADVKEMTQKKAERIKAEREEEERQRQAEENSRWQHYWNGFNNGFGSFGNSYTDQNHASDVTIDSRLRKKAWSTLVYATHTDNENLSDAAFGKKIRTILKDDQAELLRHMDDLKIVLGV